MPAPPSETTHSRYGLSQEEHLCVSLTRLSSVGDESANALLFKCFVDRHCPAGQPSDFFRRKRPIVETDFVDLAEPELQ